MSHLGASFSPSARWIGKTDCKDPPSPDHLCSASHDTHGCVWPAEARVPRSEGEGNVAPVSITGEELNYQHRANHIPHLISTIVNISRDSMSTPKQKLFRLLCNCQKCKEVPKPFPLMTQRWPVPGLEEEGPVPRILGESLTRSLGRRRGASPTSPTVAETTEVDTLEAWGPPFLLRVPLLASTWTWTETLDYRPPPIILFQQNNNILTHY